MLAHRAGAVLRRVGHRAREEPERRLALDDAARAAALTQMDERTFVVRGTPTDCVIMGVRHLLIDQPPDLVLSGVNHGSNLAEDVTYSGTIAAAIEGTLLGIRSIAMSQVGGSLEEGTIFWETPLEHGPALVVEAARRRLADGHRHQRQLSGLPAPATSPASR